MAIDREKVTQAAQKYVEKKKYDKAVLEYQKLVQADPNDARTLLKIGDLQLKMGAHEQAIATYESVGNLYAKQGWALKAIAVYKQIREIVAKHVPHLDDKYGHIAPRLAELYQQLGLTSDALAALDEVATKLQRQQRDSEAIEVFQKIVALDPTNPLPHLRLAEALSRNKDIEGAVFEFKTAAAQLAGLGRRDDALKVLERLLHHKPDAEQARIAAELYLSRGQQADGMQALAKLQICFQANPRDLDTLTLLARAFNAIGQAGKAIEVQKEMARIARDAGKHDLAREIIDRLMRLAPHDEGVRKLALGSVPAPAPIHSQAPQAGMTAPPQQMPQMQQMHMTQPIGGGRPQQPPQYPPQQQTQAPYPPPPPAVTRPTAPVGFAPQTLPLQQQQQPVEAQEDDVEEVDELSYEDASDEVENIDDQAELLESNAPQAYAEPAEAEQEYEVEGQAYELNPDEPEYATEGATHELEGGDGNEEAAPAYAEDSAAGSAQGGEVQYAGEYQEEQVYAEQHEYVEGGEGGEGGGEAYQAQAGEDVGAQLAQVLADAQSYRRVRLYAKATETLRTGLDLEPRSMDVREALRDVLLESGQNEDAVLEMLAIASLYIDALDGESAARALQDVLAIDPTNQRAIEMLQELGYEIVDESEEQGESQDTEAGGRDAYASQGDEDRLPSYDLEEMGPEDVSARYGDNARRIRPSSQRPPPMQADGEGDDLALPSFPLDGPEDEDANAQVGGLPGNRTGLVEGGDAAYQAEGQEQGELGQDTGENYAGYAADGTDQHGAYQEEAAPSTVSPGAPRASAAPGGGGSPELEEALEESEFFVSRGLYEDARAILADHYARNPNHPLLRERIAEIDAQLEEMRGPSNAGSGAREKPQEDRSFDIAANIDALDSIETGAPQRPAFAQEQQQVDVEEVFQKFKEGVAAQISIEDSESHENLGIAYKEMGLVDDAIREFEISARDPKRECVCQFNIGMVEMERGRIAEAIDAFLRGLNAVEKEPQQETMLCFEIGAAYEVMKMNREALTYFQKTMRRDPGYRDVQERVRRLAKPEPKAAPIKAAVGADDEFDRAFDDLLGGKS